MRMIGWLKTQVLSNSESSRPPQTVTGFGMRLWTIHPFQRRSVGLLTFTHFRSLILVSRNGALSKRYDDQLKALV